MNPRIDGKQFVATCRGDAHCMYRGQFHTQTHTQPGDIQRKSPKFNNIPLRWCVDEATFSSMYIRALDHYYLPNIYNLTSTAWLPDVASEWKPGRTIAELWGEVKKPPEQFVVDDSQAQAQAQHNAGAQRLLRLFLSRWRELRHFWTTFKSECYCFLANTTTKTRKWSFSFLASRDTCCCNRCPSRRVPFLFMWIFSAPQLSYCLSTVLSPPVSSRRLKWPLIFSELDTRDLPDFCGDSALDWARQSCRKSQPKVSLSRL